MRAVYKILPLLGALYLVHWRWRARDACAGWDPGSDADAPGCLRAQQYREFQAFWASNSSLDDINFHALAGAERCVPGITHCPPRPLVIIDYRYWNRAARDRAGPGEVMWGWTVNDAVRAAGFTPIFYEGTDEHGGVAARRAWGPQEPRTYLEVLGSARALLGIGKPEISPTPYEALYRGVPVVLAYIKPDPEGWEVFYE
ncbi:uncharacterized protein COLE_05378 [Cutaneotrichosporon oleaginosum]|uniref:uncharacterized protein n=1 Tax=Cutaneotrichosporon oleaginosum TaxID=879819 RepID=UPI001323B22D|nr:hypothetical protein COLE_05378 [Cutaneotrichosporon oleaginosum]